MSHPMEEVPNADENLKAWLRERKNEIRPAEVAFLRERALGRAAERLSDLLFEQMKDEVSLLVHEEFLKQVAGKIPESIQAYIQDLASDEISDMIFEKLMGKTRVAVEALFKDKGW